MSLPTPYYERGGIVILCGDCREILPLIPDKSVDLVVTDPPYGYNEFGNWTIIEARQFWLSSMQLIKAKMKDGASFYAFTGWKFYCEARREVTEYLEYLKTLIWDKRTFIGTRGDIKTLTYHNISEPIILAYKEGAGLTFNLEDVRMPTIHNDPRSNPDGKRPGDILSFIAVRNNDTEKVEHKGQKPIELIELFIKASSNISSLILDPFLGSGTTAVAAKKLGRKCIGIEINSDYCRIAVDRLRQAVLPFEVEQVQQGQSISESLMFNGMTSPTKGNKIRGKMGIGEITEEADR